jgi:hypothetical protein
MVQSLIDTATPLIRARVAFTVSYLDAKQEDAVVIAGTRFRSRVLRQNLDQAGRVFPFVITIGGALEAKADQCSDILDKYYLDEIGNMALRKARLLFEDYLRRTFALKKISCMAPGSLEDWPIQEQSALFSLLDGVEAALGVRLTDSLLMLPRKSVSGIYFPSEASFFSCQLCPRERCDSRKARYDEELARKYGIDKA